MSLFLCVKITYDPPAAVVIVLHDMLMQVQKMMDSPEMKKMMKELQDNPGSKQVRYVTCP
jgi:hypothetical protein